MLSSRMFAPVYIPINSGCITVLNSKWNKHVGCGGPSLLPARDLEGTGPGNLSRMEIWGCSEDRLGGRFMTLVQAAEITEGVTEEQPWGLGTIAGLPWSRVQDPQAPASRLKLLAVMPRSLGSAQCPSVF